MTIKETISGGGSSLDALCRECGFEVRKEDMDRLARIEPTAYRNSYLRAFPQFRNVFSSDSILEVMEAGIPLEFTKKCADVSRECPNIIMSGTAIRQLAVLEPTHPEGLKEWKEFASWKSFDNSRTCWNNQEILLLVSLGISRDFDQFMRLKEFSSLFTSTAPITFSARECVKLIRGFKGTDMKELYTQIQKYKKDFPTSSNEDIIACLQAGIPSGSIVSFKKKEKEIQTIYNDPRLPKGTDSSWSIEDISRMYIAGIRKPEEVVNFWKSFESKEKIKPTLLAEILSFPGARECIQFLKAEQPTPILTIGKKQIPLTPSASNIGLIRSLLSNLNQRGISVPSHPTEWREQIKSYEKQMNLFLGEGKEQEFDRIFFISATSKEDGNGAFIPATTFKDELKTRYPKNPLRDYSLNSTLVLSKETRVNTFITALENHIRAFPNEKILVHIGLHGTPDGNMGDFTPFDLARLIKIARHPNIILDIMSCYGGKKFDLLTQNLGNVRLSSGNYAAGTSYNEYIEALRDKRYADFDGDGRVSYSELALFRMFYHQLNLSHTSFIARDGKIGNI